MKKELLIPDKFKSIKNIVGFRNGEKLAELNCKNITFTNEKVEFVLPENHQFNHSFFQGFYRYLINEKGLLKEQILFSGYKSLVTEKAIEYIYGSDIG